MKCVDMYKRDIVLIAAEAWENSTWRRRHHVAWALAKHYRVLFVEPPFTVFSPFKRRYVRWKQLLDLGRLKYQGRNLYSYSPLKLLPLSLPFSYKYNYDDVNKRIIFSQLKRVAKTLRIEKPILWTYFSTEQYEYYGVFDEILTVTDYYDKFTASFGYEKPNLEEMRIFEIQNSMLEKADIAFATSKELYDDVRNIIASSYYIPHGVDIELYLNKRKIEHNIFKRLDKIGKPIIGYLGSIQHKIDFSLLECIADSHPEWSLVFVGKTAINNETDRADWIRLTRKKNVYHLGETNRGLIPTILDYFDVCIIPFKKIEWLHYGAPLKIWEYLASGKPIVAINQNADYGCNSLMSIVDDRIGFEQAINNILLTKEDHKLIDERKHVAIKNSWDYRIQQMMTIIEEKLQQ